MDNIEAIKNLNAMKMNYDQRDKKAIPIQTIDMAISALEKQIPMKTILDVCCGSKMFWFDKQNENTIYMDNREVDEVLCDGRRLVVSPDIVGDFRAIPFTDNRFKLVVFDPPHLKRAGKDSWLSKKYGKLHESWPQDIKTGFSECFRVLEENGTLIFKWNEEQIPLKDILKLTPHKPLFGNKRAKTHWLVFQKTGGCNE